MADYTNIIPFILQEEGGLSKAKTDSASADPVPDGTGNHTNKGITWTAFKTFLKALGIADMTTAIKRFYAMSMPDWDYIFKAGYWDKVQGDKINSQGTANTLVDWAWGSGPVTSVKKLQQFLNGQPKYSTYTKNNIQYTFLISGWMVKNGAPDPMLSVDGGMGNATLTALNAATRINESKFITDFSTYKEAWYLSLPNQSANYAGWAARLNSLTSIALSSVKNNPGISAAIMVGVGITFFFSVQTVFV